MRFTDGSGCQRFRSSRACIRFGISKISKADNSPTSPKPIESNGILLIAIRPAGEMQCFTRWVGLPQNFGPDHNWPVFRLPGVLQSKPIRDRFGHPSKAPTRPTTTVTFRLHREGQQRQRNGDGFRVFVGQPFGIMTGSGNCIAYWEDSSERWVVIQKGC